MSASRHADELLDRARGRLRLLLPSDTVLADAHTHLGLDEDGMRLDLASLLDDMDLHGIERALVFPLNEPDRHPGYRAPNDRVLGWAAESGGRLVPLARLDLSEDPIGEAERCFAAGARGIKLHPRAQAFAVDDSRLEPVFALAERHRFPILIHAGRGMPPIGEALAQVSERHPGAILILAHAAIVDQGRIASLVAGRPNVFFDTSTWGAVDVLALLAHVSPEQLLFAADVPYGNFLTSLTMLASILEQLDVDDDIRRGIVGGTLEGIIAGELPTLSPPVGPVEGSYRHTAMRVHSYLAAATPLIWTRQPDVIGLMGLALTAASEGGDELAGVPELIEAAGRLWAEAPASVDGQGTPISAWATHMRKVYALVHLAQVALFCPRAAARVPV
ncbi:MAG: hypothetical protein AVDCRST_MAG79-1186 [uncultured Thermoleophilia bacterium]|uniref:Amidohydrolase-related domain-containing protein n=1 Tax=uncultured Thermoleophilia bacterium TaxID=1497501 RepID=A0A6J4TX87_9ACTN|nr:MAG: hypothetical protein AVDCRST_MAG79-1186 [uncultured Thermoleophilia bacterium]